MFYMLTKHISAKKYPIYRAIANLKKLESVLVEIIHRNRSLYCTVTGLHLLQEQRQGKVWKSPTFPLLICST